MSGGHGGRPVREVVVELREPIGALPYWYGELRVNGEVLEHTDTIGAPDITGFGHEDEAADVRAFLEGEWLPEYVEGDDW